MIPSRDLSPLLPPLGPPAISSQLASIRNQFLAPVTIDLRQPLEVNVNSEKKERVLIGGDQNGAVHELEERADEYEIKVLRGWLERVVHAGLKQQARMVPGDYEQWEAAIDEASSILSRLEDDSEQTLYLLPSPSSPLPPPKPIMIHNHTLLSSTTGHRTWGSSPILSRRLALEPDLFFPTQSPSAPLRVLELGSGTGLVGLSAISVLSSLGFSNTTVTLSDGGEASENAISTHVLENLRRNLSGHVENCNLGGSGVQAQVQILSWNDYLASPPQGGDLKGRHTVKEDEKYDVILGADLVYEDMQAESLGAAVATFLRFPTSLQHFSPAFHLVIPIRPTHRQELEAVDKVFPSSPLPPPSSESTRIAEGDDGQKWMLIAKDRQEFSGPDGFTRRGKGEKVIRYRYYRIEWEKAQDARAN